MNSVQQGFGDLCRVMGKGVCGGRWGLQRQNPLTHWQPTGNLPEIHMALNGYPHDGSLSRPCPTPVTRPVKRLVTPEVFLLY